MALFLIYDGLKFRDILPYLVTAVIAVRVTIKYLQAKGSPVCSHGLQFFLVY